MKQIWPDDADEAAEDELAGITPLNCQECGAEFRIRKTVLAVGPFTYNCWCGFKINFSRVQ